MAVWQMQMKQNWQGKGGNQPERVLGSGLGGPKPPMGNSNSGSHEVLLFAVLRLWQARQGWHDGRHGHDHPQPCQVQDAALHALDAGHVHQGGLLHICSWGARDAGRFQPERAGQDQLQWEQPLVSAGKAFRFRTFWHLFGGPQVNMNK